MTVDRALTDASDLSTASLHEAAGRIGALPAAIKPLAPHVRIFGPAFPVRCPAGDNLFLHHAIYAAAPGDVLVVDCGDVAEFGHWGDIMASAAQVRGLSGLVITGGVRDSQQLLSLNFPTFAGCVSIRGTGKDPEGPGQIGEPVSIGGVIVKQGDMVVGDADGVVVIPQNEASDILSKARQRDRDEDEILRRLRAGETTLEIYGLPALSDERRALSGRRSSIHVEGLSHAGLPIPTASRVGKVIATGGIRGVDPTTNLMPEDVHEQARLMFENLRRTVEAAGGGVGDILKVGIWIATPEGRAALNEPWTALFPDAESRPARHVVIYDLPGGMLVQCDALAVLP